MSENVIRVIVQDGSGESAPSKNPTAPDDKVNTDTAVDVEDKVPSITPKQAIAIASSPVRAIASKAIGAVPVIGAALAVAAVAVKISSFAFSLSLIQSGDSQARMSMGNIGLAFSHAMNPISFQSSLIKERVEIGVRNQAIEQNRILYGEADVNGTQKRGV